jgi:hypothetical protein
MLDQRGRLPRRTKEGPVLAKVVEWERMRMYTICQNEPRDFSEVVSLGECPEAEAVLRTHSRAVLDFPRYAAELVRIYECADELKTNYEDAEDRQILHAKLQSLLRGLRRKASQATPAFSRLINMLIDTLSNTKSENMTREQVGTLLWCLQNMNENTEEFETDEFENLLISVGLKPVPDIRGLAKYYRE